MNDFGGPSKLLQFLAFGTTWDVFLSQSPQGYRIWTPFRTFPYTVSSANPHSRDDSGRFSVDRSRLHNFLNFIKNVERAVENDQNAPIITSWGCFGASWGVTWGLLGVSWGLLSPWVVLERFFVKTGAWAGFRGSEAG